MSKGRRNTPLQNSEIKGKVLTWIEVKVRKRELRDTHRKKET